MLKTIYVTGYRSFELNIFSTKDKKLEVLKHALKEEIVRFIEEGVEWVLISGNLGVECWAGEVVLALKKEEYEIKLGVIFPFENFGENWNEINQMVLNNLKNQADYVNATSHKPYENAIQLRAHTQFLLEHTQGALIVYDEEYEGKPKYFYQDAKRLSEVKGYELRQVDMYSLENYAEDLYEEDYGFD